MRRRHILLLSAFAALLALPMHARGAGPITNITILFSADSTRNFSAGVATNTTIPSEIFINTFAEGSSIPDAGQVVQLQLLHNGEVIENGMHPTSLTTTGTSQVNGGNSPFPITFFRSGSGLQLRAIAGSVQRTSADSFTVQAGAAEKLVVIGPGMTHKPGTNPDLTNGRGGSFTPQEANQAFPIKVILTDAQFNKVSGTPPITFEPADLVDTPAAGNLVAGEREFSVTITGVRITRTLTATSPGIDAGSLDITTAGPPTKEVFPFPSPFNPHQQNITFRFRLEGPKSVTLIVTDLFGQSVWQQTVNGSLGFNDITWNGRNDRGHVVAAGVYYALLEIDGSIDSKKRFGVIK